MCADTNCADVLSVADAARAADRVIMMQPSFDGGFRNLWDQVRWATHDYRMEQELQRIVVAGLPGAGKKTLFNTLWGASVIQHQPLPLNGADFGLFRLMDLPCEMDEALLYPFPLEDASVIVYVLNSRAGLSADDFRWISRLRVGRAALLVILNQIDDQPIADVSAIEEQLALKVVPLRVNNPADARGLFVDALLRTSPELLSALAAQLAHVRHVAAHRIIRQAVVLGMAVSVEPLPLLDLPLLLGVQLRLLGQLSALYGKRVSFQSDWHTVLAVVFGVLLRYVAQTLMKFIPWGGWIVSGIVGASATWAVGQTALLLHEGRIQDVLPLLWLRWAERQVHAAAKRLRP